MHILKPVPDFLSQNLWDGGGVICLLTSPPGDCEAAKGWEQLYWAGLWLNIILKIIITIMYFKQILFILSSISQDMLHKYVFCFLVAQFSQCKQYPVLKIYAFI